MTRNPRSGEEGNTRDVEVLVQSPRRATPIALGSRVFRALDNGNYRLVLFGALLSNTGTWIQKTAQSWLVLTLSDSPFYLGLDAVASDAPLLLFSLLGGVTADRFDRKKLLIWTQLARLTLAALLAALAFQGSIQVWHIIAISFLSGCVEAISVPTYLSFMPTLVPRQDLPSALALNSTQFNLSRIIGPAVAGIMLLRGGAALCFLLNSLSFLAVIFSLVWVRERASASLHRTMPVWQSLLQGAEYVRRHRLLPLYLLSVLFFSLAASPLVTLLPLFARDVLKTGAGGYSRLLSFFGVGAVLGALGVAGSMNLRRKLDRVMAGMLIFAFCCFGFSLSHSPAYSATIVLIAGASMIACSVMLNTMVQSESPQVLRGRVMSMYGLAFRGGMSLGNLISACIAQYWSGPAAVAVQGIFLLGYVVLFSLFLRPRFRSSLLNEAGRRKQIVSRSINC